MDSGSSERGQWQSSLGFILAAAGSAIGLGNIWRFPYQAGENGGAAFVVLYLACIALICLPYLLGELALGRNSQKNPVGAIKAIVPESGWRYVGWLGVLTGVGILSYYAVIAGWTFGFIFKTLFGRSTDFGAFIQSPLLVIPLFSLFILFTVYVVLGGVRDGIERWAKILMPVLLVLMVLVIVRSVTLEGAGAGLSFYLEPDLSKVSGGMVLAALTQAFFSLSLGMGTMLTYGSYLSKDDSILSSGLYVAGFDTVIALMAGLMIFPAVFAMGASPGQGPALIFQVLPEIFAEMPMGTVIGALFFLLLSIAALTSTISLLEVPVAYLVDEQNWTRSRAVWTLGGIVFVIGLPSALSQGAVGGLTSFAGGLDFLTLMDMIWGQTALAVGALLLSIFIGWVWTADAASEEIRRGSDSFVEVGGIWRFFIRYVCPAVIFVVLLYQLWTVWIG